MLDFLYHYKTVFGAVGLSSFFLFISIMVGAIILIEKPTKEMKKLALFLIYTPLAVWTLLIIIAVLIMIEGFSRKGNPNKEIQSYAIKKEVSDAKERSLYLYNFVVITGTGEADRADYGMFPTLEECQVAINNMTTIQGEGWLRKGSQVGTGTAVCHRVKKGE